MVKTPELNFAGRVALITGAGKGLGRCYAEWLAARGASVVVNNRRHPDQPCSAALVVEAIRAKGGKAIAVDGSVENEHEAHAMVRAAHEAFGRLDILICNAGISPGGSFHKMDMDLFRQVVNVNFYGTVHPIRAALPAMREAGYGRVVITTSASAYYGAFGLSAYGAAKAAVIGLARSLTVENAEKNIRFNVISPFAFTPMTVPFVAPEHRERLQPERIAPMVGWLASEQCGASAAIIEAGGGNYRRIVFGGGRVIACSAGDEANIWPALEDFSGVAEILDVSGGAEFLLSGT